MRMDKLTSRFQMAVADAQSLAVGRDHPYIEPLHLVLALLQRVGVNLHQLRTELGKSLERLPRVEGTAGEVLVSNDLGRLLNVTDKLAQQRGDQSIASERFGLAAAEDPGEVGRILRGAGANREALERAVEELRGGEPVADPEAEEQRQALERYTIDLTERAEAGKPDPVIGRDDEIRRVIQVLQRRTARR